MANAIKGLLLSALVFPGLGQIALRRYQRGVVLMLATLAGLVVIVAKAAREAGRILDTIESEGGVIDQDAWRADRERLEALSKRMQDGIDAITELGGVPKDVGLGLVDFPHLRDGREVNLCWKYGERAIRFWHGLDEGYAARKPL